MLVLSRKTGESIVLSGRITITVNRISGDRVALAFDAPSHVNIRRSELPVFDDEIDDKLDRLLIEASLAIDETHAAPK